MRVQVGSLSSSVRPKSCRTEPEKGLFDSVFGIQAVWFLKKLPKLTEFLVSIIFRLKVWLKSVKFGKF